MKATTRALWWFLIPVLLAGCGGPFGAGWGRTDIPVHRAAWSGNESEILRLHTIGEPMDEVAAIPSGIMSAEGVRPLDLAAYGRQQRAYDALLECGVKPGPAHLIWAVGDAPRGDAAWHRTGSLEYARRLLDAGADPNGVSQEKTPLTVAAGCGNVDAVRLLLKYHADPNLALRDGTTPLLAAGLGSVACTQVLLKAGADARAIDKQGRNALSPPSARVSNHFASTPESVAMLVNAGANPNQVDEKGDTPLARYLTGPVADALIASGADPLYIATDGRTLLHRVAVRVPPIPDAVSRYVSLGVDVNAFDDAHQTALDIAVDNVMSWGDYAQPTLVALLRAGASPDLSPGDGHETTLSRSKQALAKALQDAQAEAEAGGNPANKHNPDIKYVIGNSHSGDIANAKAVIRALQPYSKATTAGID